jgi:SAM-dependent methyltransferase
VLWVNRNRFASRWSWLSFDILQDFADRDPSAFHRFLWSNHLLYAETYDPARCFGLTRMHATRRLLFADIKEHLRSFGVDPVKAIKSVFEVGCSVGHVLRFIETDVFPDATVLRGIDVDRLAIESGQKELAAQKSIVEIETGDMADLEARLDRNFDLILCAGVLQYFRQGDAAKVVSAMLHRSAKLVALTGLAHPDCDNGTLDQSAIRREDKSHIHNIDAMVHAAGGSVVKRRWEGSTLLEGRGIYFVLAAPGAGLDTVSGF